MLYLCVTSLYLMYIWCIWCVVRVGVDVGFDFRVRVVHEMGSALWWPRWLSGLCWSRNWYWTWWDLGFYVIFGKNTSKHAMTTRYFKRIRHRAFVYELKDVRDIGNERCAVGFTVRKVNLDASWLRTMWFDAGTLYLCVMSLYFGVLCWDCCILIEFVVAVFMRLCTKLFLGVCGRNCFRAFLY